MQKTKYIVLGSLVTFGLLAIIGVVAEGKKNPPVRLKYYRHQDVKKLEQAKV